MPPDPPSAVLAFGAFVSGVDSRGRVRHGYLERLDPFHSYTAYVWVDDVLEVLRTDTLRRQYLKEPW